VPERKVDLWKVAPIIIFLLGLASVGGALQAQVSAQANEQKKLSELPAQMAGLEQKVAGHIENFKEFKTDYKSDIDRHEGKLDRILNRLMGSSIQ